MAKSAPKLTPSRDIPLDRLELSPSDVLGMRLAAEIPGEMRPLCAIKGFEARGPAETVPIVGREWIGRVRAMPPFLFVVEIHMPCLPVREDKARSRV